FCFQAEDGIRDRNVTGVQTCALPILEADPLILNPLDNEYLLRPLRLQDGHTEIYSVDNIHGSVKNGRHPYVPFTSFRHRGGMMRSEERRVGKEGRWGRVGSAEVERSR